MNRKSPASTLPIVKPALTALVLGLGSSFLVALDATAVFGATEDAVAVPRACSDPFLEGPPQFLGSTLFTCGVDNVDAVWTGASVAVAWDRYECGGVGVAVVDLFGAPLGPETALPGTGLSRQVQPSLAWSGSEIGVAWDEERGPTFGDVYLTRLDPSGAILADPSKITEGSLGPSGQRIVWTGSKYGVFWIDNRIEGNDIVPYQLAFARVGANGQPTAKTLLLTAPHTVLTRPSLIWTGTSYALAYWNESGLVLTTLRPMGKRVKTTVLTTTPAALEAALAWNGSEIIVVWSDLRDGFGALYSTRFDSRGRKLGPDVRLTDRSFVYPVASRITWNGAEYGLAFDDDRDGNPEVYFARLSPTGAWVGNALRVTFGSLLSVPERLLWMGDAYGLVFTEAGDNIPRDPYFVRIGCN